MVIIDDDAFFNRDCAGACKGRWTGPRLLLGWTTGSCFVGAEIGLSQCWSAGSGSGAPLQKITRKEKEPAGASPVATPMPKSVSFWEKRNYLEGECLAYVSV